MSATLAMDEADVEQSFLADVMAKLWRRKLVIMTLTLILFAGFAIGIQFLPHSYQAVASVSVEQTPKAVATGNVVQDIPFDDETIGTELALLNSQELLTETLRRTNLLRNPEFNPHLNTSLLAKLDAASNGRLAQWLPYLTGWLPHSESDDSTAAERQVADTLATLRKKVQLIPVPRSRVINVIVSTRNPELSAQVANTIASLYIADHLNYREDMNKAAHDFVDQRVQELKDAATAAATAVMNFRIQHGLTATSDRDNSTLLQQQATAVNAQLQDARNRLAILQSQYDGDRKSDPETLAAALSSPTMARLRDQEAQALSDRARLASSYGENSPVLGQANVRVASIRAQIHAEAMRAVQALPSQITSAKDTVASLTQRLADLQKQLGSMDSARAELALLEVESTAQNNIYREFLERSKQTDTAVLFPATPVRIISRAVAPTRPSFPDNKLMLPASGIAALMMSLGIGMLLERRKGLASTTDVEHLLGVPALGMLPVRSAKTENMYQDGIEDLLSRLLYDHGASSVLITSAVPHEGKTTTAQALVKAAINRGLNALLIEADMRSSYGGRRLSKEANLGLGDVLRGEIMARDAVRRPSTELAVLPAGKSRGNAARLLSNPRMKLAVETLKREYDFIVVDAPPALVGPDAWSLSRHVDSTVLIARWEDTEPKQVALAIRQLLLPSNGMRDDDYHRRGTNLAGLVLNMVDPSRCLRLGNADSIRFSSAMFKYYRR